MSLMSVKCPNCQAFHIRRARVMNYAYCPICGYKWALNPSLPCNLNATVCMDCWGTGYYFKQETKITCETCNGGGWL